MNPPLSGKQQRENYKFLFDELRKTVAARKDQRRKEQAHQQKMKQSDDKHMQKMDVPPMRGMPMNPEAGPTDKIPALLTKGEAVIPRKAAQNPQNKPLIKAMVKEGRSDVNMSVPKPGYMCGTTSVKGYADGTTYVTDEYGNPVDESGNFVDQQIQLQEIPKPQAVVYAQTDEYGNALGQEGPQYIPTGKEAIPQAQANIQDMEGSSGNIPMVDTNTIPSNEVNTDQNFLDYTKARESSNNYGIGKHSDASSAWGAYGITDSAWKDIVASNPSFAKMNKEELTPEGQDQVALEYRKILADQLKSKGIEPTEGNLRAAWYTGAGGLASYLKDNKVPAGANAEEIEKRLAGEGGVPRVTTGIGIKPEQPSGVGVNPEVPKVQNLGASVYTDPVVPLATKPESEGGYLNTIADGIQGVWDTIKDPKELGNFISSFVKDTLGFNAQDAARFGLLVAGSKALGYNTTQAVRYAGNYTLVASDKRATAKNLADSQMNIAMANRKAAQDQALITKGAVRNSKGELVSPGFRDTGEMKSMTFDSGPNKNKSFNMIKKVDPLSNQTVWVDSISNKTAAQLQAANGNRALVPYNEADSPAGKAKAFSTWANSLGPDQEKILENEFPKGEKGKANPMRAGLPVGTEIANRAVTKLKEAGYDIQDADQQNEMNNVVSAATRAMAGEKKNNAGASIKSIDNYIEKNIIVYKTGLDNSALFETQKGNLIPTNKIVEQKNQLSNAIRKENPSIPEAKINDLLFNKYKELQQEWITSETTRNSFNKQAPKDSSGFYVFVQEYIKLNNKRK